MQKPQNNNNHFAAIIQVNMC